MQQNQRIGAFRLNFGPLRAQRRALEVSQVQLGSVAGISDQGVRRLEAGLRNRQVSVHELVAYSRALGLPMDKLFRVEDE